MLNNNRYITFVTLIKFIDRFFIGCEKLHCVTNDKDLISNIPDIHTDIKDCIDRPGVPESHDACAFHCLYD